MNGSNVIFYAMVIKREVIYLLLCEYVLNLAKHLTVFLLHDLIMGENDTKFLILFDYLHDFVIRFLVALST